MSFSPLPEVSLRDLHERLGLNSRRIPINGTIEATLRCNLRCVHCYVNLDRADVQARGRELPAGRWIRLIDEIADAGTLSLLLTGGEPLLRPDFPEIYAHAVRKGLLTTVFTNATLVGDRIVGLFSDLQPEAVEVTLYGATEATYERVTRVPGSYRRCMAGIERLRSRGVPLRLKAMVLTANRHEFEAIAAYANGLNLHFRFDGQLNARIDHAPNLITTQQLPAEEVAELDRKNPRYADELKRFCERHTRPESGGRLDLLYSCGAGWGAYAIDPYGRLLLCELARRDGFDVREASFEEGWRELLPRLRERRFERNHVCPSCSLISLCGNCPGAAEIETGDPEGIVRTLCEIAHRRVWSLMGAACGHRADASCCAGQFHHAASANAGRAWSIG